MFDIDNSVLVIVDVQEKLTAIINQNQKMLDNIIILAKAANILNMPIINCRQYPQGLGDTVGPIKDAMGDCKSIDKITFSCLSDDGFKTALSFLKRRQVIICGIETHVCIYQTAMELAARGYEAGLVADATSSRAETNKHFAIERMKTEGIKIYTTEMILFELLKTAKHPAFKEISKLVK
jgi:nicotinamidase-related amidase